MIKEIYVLLFLQFIIIKSQECKENENNCKICDPFKKLCHECEPNIFIPDEKGGCTGIKKCEIGNNYCNECNQNGILCNSCEIGYYPDNNGGCSYTDNCEISYKGECLICKDNFILIGENSNLKICKSLFNQDLRDCKLINKTDGTCLSCIEDFYLNKGDKKCSNIDNCFASHYGNCNKCNSGYYLEKRENKCKKQENNFLNCLETIDGQNCDKCEENYFFDQEGKCIPTNFCSKSINFECVECISGYYLTEDKSCSINKNCKSAYKNNGICNWCSNNYYLNEENKCISYSDSENELKFCKIFTTKCIKCDNEYTFDEDGKCVKSKNCAESEDGICTLCSKGYYLGLDKKCTNKEHCIYSNYDYTCNECEDDYYWDNSHNICKLVGNNTKYKGCKLSFGGYECSICKKGYYFNSTDSLCYDNNEKNKYYKCSRVYAGICNECEEGYFFGYGDYKCSKVEFCLNSADENTCIKCRQNYCLDGKTATCINNKEIINENLNYFRCLKTNREGLCEECEEGTVLKEGLCINENDCLEKNMDICIKCQNKTEYSYSCLNSIFWCVETQINNCLLCDDIHNFNKCNKCEEGYELNENIKKKLEK